MNTIYPAILRGCLFFLLSFFAVSVIPAQTVNDDADMPLQGKFIMSKEDYLKKRDEYINLLRGLPYNLPYNARLKALEQTRQMEINQRNDRNNLVTAPNWVQLGPMPIPNGQTTTNSVPVSGRVTAIAIHPTNANTVYVGTANGGVYRTTNGGTTWTAIFDAASSMAIGALALAPSSPTTLYVGTGESNLSADSYAGIGVYRIDNADAAPSLVGPINPNMSYNGGALITGAFTNNSISKILVHPTQAGTIWVATTTGTGGNPSSGPGFSVPPTGLLGLYRSTNATAAAGVVTFTKLAVCTANSFDVPNTGSRSIIDVVMPPNAPDTLLAYVRGTTAAGDGGIYRCTNAMAATPVFTRTYTPTGNNLRGELSLCKPVAGGLVTVYVAIGEIVSGTTGGKVHRSDDGGLTWTTLTGGNTFCGGQCFYDIAVKVKPDDASVVLLGGSSGSVLYQKSTDSAKTFVSMPTNLHADVHTIEYAPNNLNIVYQGNDGGIFKSSDGGSTWASINTTGFSATQFQSMAMHPVDPKFTIGGTQDNGTNMYKPDGSFNRIDFGDGGYTLIDQNATDNTNVTMYHTYFNQTNAQGIARVDLVASATEGNWPLYGCGFGGVNVNGMSCSGITSILFYAPIAQGPGNPNTVYFGSDRLYRSSDKAVTMTLASQAPIVSGVAISSISIAYGDDNVRIVGLSNGQVWGTFTGSSTLVNITPPGAPSRPVGRVFIDRTNKNTAYVCYGGFGVTAGQHIWKTTNLNLLAGGITWAASGAGLPDVPVNAFVNDFPFPNVLFCGTDIGVFVSSNGGASWGSFNAGLPAVPVFDMGIHPVTKNLRIATHGRGLWESTENILPITLGDFTAVAKTGGKVLLQWYTSTEINNKGFEVERALVNGTALLKWQKIGYVNGSGNSTTPKHYMLDDMPVGGKKFIYRLKQVDYDGRYKYSDERQVQLRDFDFALFPVYPNPVSKTATIRYQVTDDATVHLSLFQADGKLVKQLVNENKEAGIYQADVDVSSLPAGNYYYRIEAGGLFDTKRLVVQKN